MISGSELAVEVRARLEDVTKELDRAERRNPGGPIAMKKRAQVYILESLVDWIDEKEAEAVAQMEQTMGLPTKGSTCDTPQSC